MQWSLLFILNSALLGLGLAMDAFSVSLANGLSHPCMRAKKMALLAGVFALFQAAMPMIGWVCVHTIVQVFAPLERLIPWIALILLGYIGGKMLYGGLRGGEDCEHPTTLGVKTVLLQGLATSIDALSVGFTISVYNWQMAVVCALIIAVVTFIICVGGLALGKRFGMHLSGKAEILGGVILILIGLEIFLKGVL